LTTSRSTRAPGDAAGLRVERRLAEDHARHVLDLGEALVDRSRVEAELFDHQAGDQDDRVVGVGVEGVRLLVVFRLEP
jgi:hypothetical protein